MKTCTKCGETKALEAFNLDKRHNTRRTSACRTCASAQRRAHYKANHERMSKAAAERRRLWRQRHPEEARQRSTETSRQLRAADPDYFNRWYHEHSDVEREKARTRMAQLRKERPDLERKRKRRYRETNLASVRARERENTQRRRAMKGHASPKLAALMERLLREPCAYCGSTENVTIDHVVPLSRGGRHEAENLAPACFSCNSSKCALLLEEWLGRLGRTAG